MKRAFILSVALLFLLAAHRGAEWSRAQVRTARPASPSGAEAPLYLPNPQFVRALTLGFDNVAADLLWFHTVNYFGKRFRDRKSLPWFGSMCDLVASLDPRAEHVYEFCGTLLSWIANDPAASDRILSRAVESRPKYWRYYYLRAFNSWYFLHRRDRALQDLRRAAAFPDAPPLVASLASRMLVADKDADTAAQFLEEMLSRTQDRAARVALADRLKRARLTSDLQKLQEAVTHFTARSGRPPADLKEIASAGIITHLPQDPFGGTYVLDAKNGTVGTTSGEKGLEYKEITVETGILHRRARKTP